MEQTTYRFAPHPSSGVLLGLRAPQLAGLALAAALALGALHLGGLAGLALALALLLLAGGALLLPSGRLDPVRPAEPWALPAELSDIELLEAELARYDGARLGVAKDVRARTFTAALRVQGRAFALLSPREREHLSSHNHPDSPPAPVTFLSHTREPREKSREEPED